MKRLLILTALLCTASFVQAQRMPVTTSSDAARAAYVQGVAALTNADFASGRVHFDAALAADPGFAMAHMYRAVAAADGRTEHLQQATTLGAGASEAERQQIAAYAADQSGDLDREVQILTALAGRYPNDPMPMFIVANVETGRGNAAAAIAAARSALTADPAFAPAYNTLGYAEMAAGNTAGAEQAFRDYIRAAPDEPNPYDSMGEFLMMQGRFDESEAQYRMALTKDPDFTNATDMLARVGIERSSLRFEQAIADGDADAIAALYMENAQALPPDAPVLVGRAAIRADFAAMLASGIRDVQLETVSVARYGDTAVEQATIAVRQGGETVMTGKSLVMWRLVDGEWLYFRDMWNWDAAMPASN